ncbi:MAG: hypothetical protein Q3M24_03780 [Candidatus Electrothrix aestuarii]|uniref:Transglutaminase elicitor n=1 Tax=Candidatus Electrothrix aestuarii TaxID=3062594 RepID=A0AAU8LXZ0_9BACT|nr:hypothetical protein [Candidatus Electrothrix aestuarii]
MSEEQGKEMNTGVQAFHENPVEFMKSIPPKYDGEALDSSGASIFDKAGIEESAHVDARDALRQKVTEKDEIAVGRAAFADNDEADGFVDQFSFSGLQSMEENGLMQAKLDVSPWSDDYWGLYLGALGHRYADPNFPGSADWKANYDYIQNNPAGRVLAQGNSEEINCLSPSEKYDILVGDSEYSLTRKMWELGKKYYVDKGHVETWMGLCHGWAPASYMLPRPTGTAKVLAADGETYITFYPADIKALATLLWAKVKYRSRFIGGRCNDKNPALDPQTGRILSQICFDTNPGTWHLAIVNQIGASRRSMVMDATYDYQVWNQPVLSYSYRYFNPQSMYYADALAEARVPVGQFSNDKFAQFRSNETDSIVGVEMKVSYIVETPPTHSEKDSEANDQVKTVVYLYDLELDFAGNIIGGEWYQNAHPDFLWTPVQGERIVTAAERHIPLPGKWQSGEPMEAQWQQSASMAAEYEKAPLAAIVEQLIAFSRS